MNSSQRAARQHADQLEKRVGADCDPADLCTPCRLLVVEVAALRVEGALTED